MANRRWSDVEGFPGYQVSDDGIIYNERFATELAIRTNRGGHMYVGLMRDGKQHVRALAILVGTAFVPNDDPSQNTIAFRDGNRANCDYRNLIWRSRSFAIRYMDERLRDLSLHRINREIVNFDTGEIFGNSEEVSYHYGVLEEDVIRACLMNILEGDPILLYPNNLHFRIRY